MTGRDEAQARALFQERYRNTPSLLARQIEQQVIGGDWARQQRRASMPLKLWPRIGQVAVAESFVAGATVTMCPRSVPSLVA